MSKNWKSELNEQTLLSYYSLLFCVAAADSTIDKSELELIYDSIDPSQLSPEGHDILDHYLIEQPTLKSTLKPLSELSDEIRFGIYLSCLEISLVDDIIVNSEQEILDEIKYSFLIRELQHDEMISFILKVKEIKERGKDDSYAADALKQATSGLTAVGIPIAAVYFSGSVIGLSAAGVTSGLAALGLGLGMVPGIGIAVLIGVGVFFGIKKVLYSKDETEKLEREELEKRKAQAIIKNLQSTISVLLTEQEKLMKKGQESDANKLALEELEKRIKYLKVIITKKTDLVLASA